MTKFISVQVKDKVYYFDEEGYNDYLELDDEQKFFLTMTLAQACIDTEHDVIYKCKMSMKELFDKYYGVING